MKLDVISGKSEVILAHYNPEGVYFNIFPMLDGMYELIKVACLFREGTTV